MIGFDEIVGNESVKEHMRIALNGKKIPHGYILNGEDGMGKMSLTFNYVKMILCEGDGSDGCRCRSCKQILSGNHPDVIYVSHAKPASIGVDDVRDGINESILIKPYQSPYKIYIVDEAEKMTQQAQNALLKTIEEPPAYGIIFLLTTNAQSFLPTILSRCVVLNLRPLTDVQVRERLKTVCPNTTKSEVIVRLARGNIGKALRYAESDDFYETVGVFFKMFREIDRMKIEDILDTIRAMKNDDFSQEDCLDFIRTWYRDVLLFKSAGKSSLLVFAEERETIEREAGRLSFDRIREIFDALEDVRRRLDANVNYELAMELLLLKMKG